MFIIFCVYGAIFKFVVLLIKMSGMTLGAAISIDTDITVQVYTVFLA
jgi:hypothetical protein